MVRNRLGAAACAAAVVIVCSGAAAVGAAHRHSRPHAPPHPKATPALVARLDALENQIAAAEDVRAIEKLQRAYGYYVDKGMWEDVAALFTEDAVGNYPAGVFVGRSSIRQHLYMNVGGGNVGDVGLGDNRLYNHMQIQPVVHLDPGGSHARGRWRALAMFGRFGAGATWAEGIYEIGYVKDHGVWKIHTLDYYSGFGAPYQTGWVAPQTPRTAEPRQLAHPADRERKLECDGFPAACIAPFHYDNPGTTAAGHVWTSVDERAVHNKNSDVAWRAAELAHRALRLEDEQKIQNLQRIYGYYIDRAMWDQAADLFANDGTFESGLSGVYVGKNHVRRFLGLSGPQGLVFGQMNDHLQLQVIVDVSPSGLSARARSRELAMTGQYPVQGTWTEGVYENTFVKQGGVWKFKALHFYPTFISDYDKGWAQDAQPVPTASTVVPPDRPPSEVYQIYPQAYIPAYHYRNPVTGNAPHYPRLGAPSQHSAAAALAPFTGKVRLPEVDDVDAIVSATERRVGRVKDYYELENLESAYGYYLDKNLFNNLADLFARDGSIELAQRGLYRGRDRVRAFLLHVFTRDGKEGPVEGRLGNHIQIQPVIDVADDGLSGRIRIRMLQQMSLGGRASLGGAVYENEVVKEEGVWKFKVDHTYNTFSASYAGGWAKGASKGMPGPSADLPPDAPPTQVFDLFPVVYEIPYHYANPVMGAAPGPPVPVGMPARIAAVLREMGPKIEAARTTELYSPLLPKEPYQGVLLTRDVHYGPHERHVLDLFAPSAGNVAGQRPPRPVLVFVHGGGFSRGAKHTAGSPFYDNIGVWAVDHGLLGVTINYRLAPQYPWPAGIEDLTLLVGWLKSHVAEYGGDPARIFLWGHSAGAAHVGDYVAHQATGTPLPVASDAAAGNADARAGGEVKPDAKSGRATKSARADRAARGAVASALPGQGSGSGDPAAGAAGGGAVAGAILTSGFYTLGDKVSLWKDYYGSDLTQYAARAALPGLLQTSTPLFVTYAQLDPESFQPESVRLIAARAAAGKPVRSLKLAGHSHISEIYAVGSGDESLSGPVLEFIRSAGAP